MHAGSIAAVTHSPAENLHHIHSNTLSGATCTANTLPACNTCIYSAACNASACSTHTAHSAHSAPQRPQRSCGLLHLRYLPTASTMPQLSISLSNPPQIPRVHHPRLQRILLAAFQTFHTFACSRTVATCSVACACSAVCACTPSPVAPFSPIAPPLRLQQCAPPSPNQDPRRLQHHLWLQCQHHLSIPCSTAHLQRRLSA